VTRRIGSGNYSPTSDEKPRWAPVFQDKHQESRTEIKLPDWNFNVGTTHDVRVDLQANYTYQRATDVTSPEAKNYRDQIPYTPLHSGSGSAALRTPWIDAAYTVVAVGDRYYMSQNLPENRVNGYAEHTIALSRTFHIHHPDGCRIRVQAECVNWMDAQYDIIKYYPMPGRSLRATVAVTL